MPDQTLDPKSSQKPSFKIDLKQVASWIIFEDSDWLVFDKPAGITLQDNHSGQAAMIHYLNTYLASLDDYQKSQTFSPSFGYRLDKDTSGVLIVGKSYQALQYINQIIRERQIEKVYKTIVFGETPNYALIEHALQKSYNNKFQRGQMEVVKQGGLDAKTEYRKEKTREHSQLGKLSLLKVKLHTGRMHQIRIHLAQEGYPVLGDLVYGDPASNRILYKHLHIKRQLLHCQKYEFLDWNGKFLSFEAQLPQDFDQLLTFRF